MRVPMDFQGPFHAVPTDQEVICFCKPRGASPGKPIPRRGTPRGISLLTRKENSPGSMNGRLHVQLRCRPGCAGAEAPTHHPSPHGPGILTRFPFDTTCCPESTRFTCTTLARVLGSTHPCPNAVLMEPFSTSVFKVLI